MAVWFILQRKGSIDAVFTMQRHLELHQLAYLMKAMLMHFKADVYSQFPHHDRKEKSFHAE